MCHSSIDIELFRKNSADQLVIVHVMDSSLLVEFEDDSLDPKCRIVTTYAWGRRARAEASEEAGGLNSLGGWLVGPRRNGRNGQKDDPSSGQR
ncbi:hypothetical protein THAOC_10710, partial [Thalassiosira oceanica]